jgi:hypothetical protein
MRPTFAALVFVALVFWPVGAFAQDNLDPTSASGIVELVVKFGIAPVGFGAIVYWLVRHHIPSQQATFKEVIGSQATSFKDALGAVIADHKEGVAELKAAIRDEGALNRESRSVNSEQLRKTLTGMTRKQLRASDDAADAADDAESDNDLPVRRGRSTG